MSHEHALAQAEADLRSGAHRAVLPRLEPLLDRLTGDDRIRALVALACAHVVVNGGFRTARTLAEEAVGLAREASSEHLAAASMALGQALLATREHAAAERAIGEAAELARARGLPAIEARAVAYLGLIRVQVHDFDGAGPLLREGAAGLEAAGDLREAALRWMGLANLELWRGRRAEAEVCFDRAEACAADFPEVLADVLRNRSKLAKQTGDLDGARALLRRAGALLDEGRSPLQWARLHNDLGAIERMLGHPDRAREHLRASLRLRKGVEEGITRLNLAVLELDDGAFEEARRIVAPALDEVGLPWVRVFARAVLVAATSDPAELDAHLDVIEPSAGRAATYVEPELLDLLTKTAHRWAGRDPGRAARVATLAHEQATALDHRVAEVEELLRNLRGAGAAAPLGPFALIRQVRSGGMGQVWRGVLRGTDVEVAVKVLAPDRAGDDTAAALRRELRAVAALDHPGIVPLLDFGEIPPALAAMTDGALQAGSPWLATRWAGCGTLADWVGRRPFRQVRDALLQLLDALAAAHARGLLHLDVKPANVLVASDDPLRTWLTDFGVARALGGEAGAAVAGTPAYMAPEQCRGRTRHYGPWTDLYALGGLAVALVQGRTPFEGTSIELLRQQVVLPAPPLAPVVPVPDGFEAWCARLLAKAPEERFRCAADAAAALRALPDAPDGPLLQVTGPRVGGSSSFSTFLLDEVAYPSVVAPVSERPAAPPVAAPLEAPALEVRTAPSPRLAVAASRLLPLRPVPLVGRDAERAALWKALREVGSDGRARVVMLDAAGGTGRTHLARWVAEAAARTGAARMVWVGNADADPWRSTLAGLLHADGLSLGALEHELPRLASIHLGSVRLGETERGLIARVLAGSGDARASTDPVPVLLRVVDELSRERPVVLVLSVADDDEVEALLGRLLDSLRDRPVLAIVPRLVALPPGPTVEVLRLDPVPPADVSGLLDALVPLEPALRDALAEASGGDPAVAVWAVRGWLAKHVLDRRAEGLVLAAAERLPADAQDAIGRLIEFALAPYPSGRRILELGAVLGSRVATETWRRCCEADGTAWVDALPDALVARGLLVEEAVGYRFATAGVRDAVLAPLGDDALRARHLAAARVSALERRGWHLLRAGRAAEALPSIREAVLAQPPDLPRRARKLIRLWDEAATAAPECELELVRGRALALEVRLGHVAESRRDALRLAEEAARLGERDAEARARVVACDALRAEQDLDGARDQAEQALALAESPRVRRTALLAVGRMTLATGDIAQALTHFQAAVALGDARARNYVVSALLSAGDLAGAAQWAEVHRPALEGGSSNDVVQRLVLAAMIDERLGRLASARERLDEAERLARAVGLNALFLTGANRLMLELRAGHLEGAHAAVAGLEALPHELSFVRLVRALLGRGRASAGERLQTARGILLSQAWGADHEELAELVELVAASPEWAEHREELLGIAGQLRQSGGRVAGRHA